MQSKCIRNLNKVRLETKKQIKDKCVLNKFSRFYTYLFNIDTLHRFNYVIILSKK